ncbi:3',5'-cyclic-nucleotide phosphodiesterase [Photobacterium profundum]|uniref:MBL fold metallo-hydrolase n=1 Tax=Photobacterium profundum TaxID=74109 RepID=UPI003D116DD7
MFQRWVFVLFISVFVFSHNATAGNNFEIVTLGDRGGIQDGNLTAFLLKASKDKNYVTLDAGTLVNGLIVAEQKGTFEHVKVPDSSPYNKVGYLLKERVKGYFISHAHLDHVAGMIIASPDDSGKSIYGLASVNQALSSSYFNWVSWPNFGDRGDGFQLKKYKYNDMPPKKWLDVKGTSLRVKAFPLSHSGIESTAFLFSNEDAAMVYLGDTGSDKVEKSDSLNQVWTSLVPYIQAGNLKGIMIEVSFTNAVKDTMLFGHLTPDWLITELKQLERKAGGKSSLEDLKIVISHVKYSLKKGEDPKVVIKRQLKEKNDLGVEFIFPVQGEGLIL